jgi:tetratricopeptide (TPR) repeat protein
MSNKAESMKVGTPRGGRARRLGAYQPTARRVALGVALLVAGLANGFAPIDGWAGSEAERLLRSGDLSGAWQASSAEVSRHPLDLDAQERRIDIALSLGLRDLVLPDLRALARGEANRADAHYLLGRISLDIGEAEAHYRAALDREPRHARALMGIGAIRRATGEPGPAAEQYRRALEIDPRLSEAWAGLQASLLQVGDLEGAVDAAQRAMRAVPDEPDPYIATATLQPERALTVLRAGVARVGDDPRLRASFARALLDAGDGPAAAEQAKAAAKLAPGYAEAGYLGLVAREMTEKRLDVDGWRELQKAQAADDRADAQRAFEELVARYPRSALAWLGLGRVRADGGDLEAAAVDLARAASVGGDEPEILATRGLVLLRAKRHDEAFPALAAAYSARPSDVALGVATVQAAAGAGRASEARQLAVAVLNRHPQDMRAIFQAAQTLSSQGDKEGAYLAIRQSIPHQPDPRVLVALAAAARDAGYYAEAAEILDRLAAVLDLPKARELAEQLKREELQRRAGSPPR